MSDGFAQEWLALRRPADAAARDNGLAEKLVTWCADRSVLRVLDLGAGSGANPAFLAPRLPIAQHWCLVDADAALLAAVEPPVADGSAIIETRCLNLTHPPDDLLDGYDLVTASALLDLVSGPWLERLVAGAARRRQAMLFTLNVDGPARWQPALPLDAWVAAAFKAHQLRDKGLGPALGPDAADRLLELAMRSGYRVLSRPSPWRLAPAQGPLQAALLEGWRGAAVEQEPDAAVTIDEWAEARRRLIEGGHSSVEIGHHDVLALPRV